MIQNKFALKRKIKRVKAVISEEDQLRADRDYCTEKEIAEFGEPLAGASVFDKKLCQYFVLLIDEKVKKIELVQSLERRAVKSGQEALASGEKKQILNALVAFKSLEVACASEDVALASLEQKLRAVKEAQTHLRIGFARQAELDVLKTTLVAADKYYDDGTRLHNMRTSDKSISDTTKRHAALYAKLFNDKIQTL